ncbi:hypothetical protein ACQKND_05660 [Viridibacillus arvi]|uniref:hypothetical protein n=1 Tax=Viridibacillus arvi TaxID=263475 RepID=UPI003CFC3D13
MLFVILLIFSLVIVYLSFELSKGNKMKRIITGVILVLSIFAYPLTFTLIMEIKPVWDSLAPIIIFHLILLLSGIIAVIVGVLTKTKLNESQKMNEEVYSRLVLKLVGSYSSLWEGS